MAEGGSDVLEGFLCPMCKADLGTAVKLLAHFEKEHNEDKDVLQSLKDLFGKAKKKILKNDVAVAADYDTQTSAKKVSGYWSDTWEPQELGEHRSHTAYFHSVRSQHVEHYTVETNKLLIRLDKLLRSLPPDPLKRKAHEQEIVPWVDEKMVKLCPSCSKSFHLARRKHHCRLCGFVMCNDCSISLDLGVARKMTITISQSDGDGSSASTSTVGAPSSSHVLGSSQIKRSNSSSSLNSVLSLVEGVHPSDSGFRVCCVCMKLLESREALCESRSSRPIILQFYERLRSYMQDANQLLPIYIKMCNSLNNGEVTYQLSEAQTYWMRLLRLAENIDALSKKILVLGSADRENPPRGRALQLQQQIRMAATSFLRNDMLGLPTLPTEAKHQQMQDQRRQEMKARIQQEQFAAQQAVLHTSQQRSRREGERDRSLDHGLKSPHRDHQDAVLADTGWTPEKAQQFSSDDPMEQQMNNLRHYIKEAKMAGKVDEVEALEKNLREIQDEYWKQQQHKRGIDEYE